MATMWFKFLLLLVFLWSVHGAQYRLSRDVMPETYEIELKPDLEGGAFSGEVRIYMRVRKAVSGITLHALDLAVERLELDYVEEDVAYELDADRNFLHVMYVDGEEIAPGEHTLYVHFTGNFSNAFGVYRYTDGESILMASKMSPIFARKAFPCFDEPLFKAKFNIRIIKPDDSYTTLSNMKQIKSYPTKSGIIDEFQTSLPMSTYLVVFLITNYNYSEVSYEKTGDTVPVRLYSHGTDEDRQFSLTVAKDVLEWLRNYTDIEYPLSKLDMIEIPNYRSSGMEHWGMIVFHKNTVVYNEDASVISRLRFETYAALLIAHEVSHFAFGNLVTHSWYSDLWLTEGFAKYMEFKAVDAVMNDWHMMDYMPRIHGTRVYTYDRSEDSLPVVNQVRSSSEVYRKYGGVLYPKGGMILRMVNYVLGEEKFQAAVQTYLKKFSYQAVSTGNLIDVFQSVEPEVNMFGFLETWLYHNKYPVVTVVEDDETDTFNITQQCVIDEYNATACSHTWTIPIFYITDKNKEPQMTWLDKDLDQITIPREGASWIKVNYKEIGIFRTNYDAGLWDKLSKNFNEFEVMDKANLINDAFALYDYGDLPCDIPLTLIGEMKNEFSYLPWAAVAEGWYSLKKHHFQGVFDIVKDYYISLAEDAYDHYSWDVKDSESIDDRFARITVLNFICVTMNYDLCDKHVWLKRRQHIDIHNDIQFIFRAVDEDSSEDEKEDVREEDIPEKAVQCSRWIKNTLSHRIKHNRSKKKNSAATNNLYFPAFLGAFYVSIVYLSATLT